MKSPPELLLQIALSQPSSAVRRLLGCFALGLGLSIATCPVLSRLSGVHQESLPAQPGSAMAACCWLACVRACSARGAGGHGTGWEGDGVAAAGAAASHTQAQASTVNLKQGDGLKPVVSLPGKLVKAWTVLCAPTRTNPNAQQRLLGGIRGQNLSLG